LCSHHRDLQTSKHDRIVLLPYLRSSQPSHHRSKNVSIEFPDNRQIHNYSRAGLPPEIVCDLYNSLLEGLNDYTIDERGDVGSWIRITCIKGLVSISSDLFMYAAKLPNLSEYLPPSQYHRVVGGILKQGVERLDSVRQEAGENFLRLLQISLTPSRESWRIHCDDLMKRLFLGWVFPLSQLAPSC
jgi:hypothetical protein